MRTGGAILLLVLLAWSAMTATVSSDAGRIAGVVTGPDCVTPLPGIEVVARHSTTSMWGWTYTTDSAGRWRIDGLEGGTYRVRFHDPRGHYATEWYDNLTDFESATDVVVVADTTTFGIDACLIERGHIAGKVTGPDGTTPLSNIAVGAFNAPTFSSVGSAYTSSTGEYDMGGLESGVYRIEFYDGFGGRFMYAWEWYDNQPDYYQATPITVTAGSAIRGIDASLEARWGEITGTVTGPDDHPALQFITVRAYVAPGNWVGNANTDEHGRYSISGLDPGSYRIEFGAGSYTYQTEWYDDQQDFDHAIDVTVRAGVVTSDVNASLLVRSGSITGTVTATDGITPLRNIYVNAYAAAGELAGSASTDEVGSYTLTDMNPGLYRIEFQDPGYRYVTEWYDNQIDYDHATAVRLQRDLVTSGINASLAERFGHITGTVTGPDGAPLLMSVTVRSCLKRSPCAHLGVEPPTPACENRAKTRSRTVRAAFQPADNYSSQLLQRQWDTFQTASENGRASK